MTDFSDRPALLTSTIVIPSYNRKEDLERTCEQISRLNPGPEAVIVVLDGCTDDSKQMIESRFPSVQLIVHARSKGSVPSRDEAFLLVKSDLIVSFDDDSYPMDYDFLARVSDLFHAHPEAAVISFPAIHDDGNPEDPNLGPDKPARNVASFISAAAVIRRSVYGPMARYVHFYEHGYEEPDLSLQCYAMGRTVWFEPSLRIRHHLSTASRSWIRVHQRKARNEVLGVIIRSPLRYAPALIAFRVFRRLQVAQREGWLLREPVWWWQAIRRIPASLRMRNPVPAPQYMSWLRLCRSANVVHSAPAEVDR